MKKFFILFGLLVCGILNAAETSTNLLSISLVDNQGFLSRSFVKTVDVIISPPVLADHDFASFDTTNQTFAITPKAAQRLADAIYVLGKKHAPGWTDHRWISPDGSYDLISMPVPFVLQVSGETIYRGIFTTLYSSDSFSGPTILADQNFITDHLTNNVTFSIQTGDPPPDGPGTGGGVDRRGDPRIVAAVQKLFPQKQ